MSALGRKVMDLAEQQGLLDGNWVADAPHFFNKGFEVTKFIFDVGSAGAGFFVMVNEKAIEAAYQLAFTPARNGAGSPIDSHSFRVQLRLAVRIRRFCRTTWLDGRLTSIQVGVRNASGWR
jgi:hypothetical protein